MSILPVLLFSLLSLGTASAQGRDPNGRVILLFGARWCAPCMAEYKGVAELAAAAAPDRVALAWIDRPIAPPIRQGFDIQAVPRDEARRMATGIGGGGYGLPFSVMLDMDGRPCAVWRHPLAPSDIPQLRELCRQRRPMAGR